MCKIFLGRDTPSKTDLALINFTKGLQRNVDCSCNEALKDTFTKDAKSGKLTKDIGWTSKDGGNMVFQSGEPEGWDYIHANEPSNK